MAEGVTVETRRGFFGLLAGALTALGLVPPARAGSAAQQLKRVFRCNEAGEWREMVWEDMRPGDKVICLSLWADGHLEGVAAWEVLTAPRGDLGQITLSQYHPLLPRVWGNPRGDEAKLARCFAFDASMPGEDAGG